MSEQFESQKPNPRSSKELPDWTEEIATAYVSFNNTVHRVDEQLEEELMSFEEEVDKRFRDYVNQMSPFLPEAVSFTDRSQEFTLNPSKERKYFLPKSWEFYRVPEFEHSAYESRYGSRQSITPESEEFIGWEDVRNKHPQLFTDTKFVKDHTYGQNVSDIDAEYSLVNIVQEELDPEHVEDLEIAKAKEQFYNAKDIRDEENRRIKTELSPKIKKQVLNMREILIHYFGKRKLPKILEPNWYNKPKYVGENMFFLPREGRLIEAPLKETSLLFRKPRADLSRARGATEEEWFDFGRDFFGKMVRAATGREPLHIKWLAEGKS